MNETIKGKRQAVPLNRDNLTDRELGGGCGIIDCIPKGLSGGKGKVFLISTGRGEIKKGNKNVGKQLKTFFPRSKKEATKAKI